MFCRQRDLRPWQSAKESVVLLSDCRRQIEELNFKQKQHISLTKKWKEPFVWSRRFNCCVLLFPVIHPARKKENSIVALERWVEVLEDEDANGQPTSPFSSLTPTANNSRVHAAPSRDFSSRVLLPSSGEWWVVYFPRWCCWHSSQQPRA